MTSRSMRARAVLATALMLFGCTDADQITSIPAGQRSTALIALGGLTWARQLGSPGFDEAVGVTVRDGAVYVAGTANGALAGQSNAGFTDLFVTRLDTDGNEQWSREFGTSQFDAAHAIASDATGIYVGGEADASLTGGSQFNTEAVIRKYDAGGNVLWTRQFGADFMSDRINAIAAGGGAVYVFGATGGTLPGQPSFGNFDLFVRKYDASGAELWTRQFGTSGIDQAWAMTVFGSDVYVSGATNGVFPGEASAGGFDGFVAKFDANGTQQWVRQFGTSGNFDPGAAVVANASGVFVGGIVTGALPGQSPSGGEDAFLRKYDPQGNIVWTRQFGSPDIDGVYAMAIDGDAIFATGRTWGSIAPGAEGTGDHFVFEFDFNGTGLTGRQYGTPAFEGPAGVAVDGGAVYIVGATAGTWPGATKIGANDGYVVKIGAPAAPPNQAPVANAGPDRTVECSGNGCATVTLDGAGSFDADGSIVSYQWFEGASQVATGASPTITLGLGTHVLTLRVADDDGATSEDAVQVIVADHTAPSLNVSATPTELWPANHKHQLVSLAVSATDACDAAPTVTAVVSSSEPDADGDIRITRADGSVVSSSSSLTALSFDPRVDRLELRAERNGNGPGRTYSIVVTARDAAGNTTSKTTTVFVPHDRR